MIHEAVYWKTGNAPGICIVGDEIRDWPESLGKKPDKATIAQWEAEYAVVKLAADQAEADRIAAKEQAIIDNLPSWAVVDQAISDATTIAALKVIVRKLSRVVYWLAKDKAT